jgi:uncharacterized protein (DUF58 family)
MLPIVDRLSSGSALFERWRQRTFRHAPDDREPVVLRHRRIYILPTKRGLAFIATLATMLVTSLNYALSLGFAVTFLLAGLAAAALLHTFRNLAGLELRPLSAGETFAGNALPFTLALAGGQAPRYGITIGAGKAFAPTVDVPPEAALPVTLEVPTARRGRLALGRVTLSSDYPLGLWRGWAYVHFPLSGVVFPAPEPEPPPLPGGPGGRDVGAVARGEDADLAGLRDYVHGDAPQRVAWKAVARGAGWYTKQFEGSGGGGPAELGWHATPASQSAEQRLSRLTAWVLAAERGARAFSLSVPGAALPVGQGRDHRRAALTALALCDPR